MSFWKKSQAKADDNGFVPGITPRSLVATILCMLLAGMYVQYSLVLLYECYMIVESAIPIPAMIVLLVLLCFVGLFGVLLKVRILTKAELVCVAFATLISVPMMGQGFWHRFLGVTSAPLRNGSFDYLDAYSDNLWPHGPNLLKDAFAVASGTYDKGGDAGLAVTPGTPAEGVTWSDVEYEEGLTGHLPTITNASISNETFLSFSIPVSHGDRSSRAMPAYPHLASILAHTEGFEAEVRQNKAMGFDGKSLINPKQIRLVHEIFAPTQKEITQAERIVRAYREQSAAGVGVFTVDGKMIDIAFIPGEERTLKLAKACGMYEGELV